MVCVLLASGVRKAKNTEAKWTQGMPLQVALATDSAPIPGEVSGEKRRQIEETGVRRDHGPYMVC